MKEITATMTKGWQKYKKESWMRRKRKEREQGGNTRRRAGGVPEREDSEVGNKR